MKDKPIHGPCFGCEDCYPEFRSPGTSSVSGAMSVYHYHTYHTAEQIAAKMEALCQRLGITRDDLDRLGSDEDRD